MTAAKEFQKAFRRKDLITLYEERIQHAQAIGIDRIRPAKLAEILESEVNIITRKVLTGSYAFTPYKEKLISKGAASPPRVVSIPTARDRLVLRALCELLQRIFPEAIPEIPQTKIEALKEALATGNFKEFVRLDLKKFYNSIGHIELEKALRKKIRKRELLALIDAAIKTPTVPESKGGKGSKPNSCGVPQGLSISNLLAEITLQSADSNIRRQSHIAYFRYVDDILILTGAGQADTIAKSSIAALRAIGLEPHDPNLHDSKSKVGTLTEIFSFLGYQINGTNISVRRESINKLEAALAGIFTAYRHSLSSARSLADKTSAVNLCEWRLNLRLTGCIFEGKRRGWMFYFSQINDSAPLRAIQHTVDILLERFSLKGTIKAKSILKVHYECKRKDPGNHKYIPNFDIMSVEKKRNILSLFMGADRVASLSEKQVERFFAMRIRYAIKELEADLAGSS